LDDYVAEASLPLPDVIKLDVQGFELEVLNGSPLCLTKAAAVVTEVSFREYYQGQASFHQIVNFLAEHRLQLVALGEGTVVGERLSQTDALFLKMSL
jgi:hypothetical protein